MIGGMKGNHTYRSCSKSARAEDPRLNDTQCLDHVCHRRHRPATLQFRTGGVDGVLH